MEKITYRGIIFNVPDYDERNINRAKTARAIRLGQLIRKPCEVCHDTFCESDAHHEKYGEYMNVRWLCKPHHKTLHNLFKKINMLLVFIEKAQNELQKDPNHRFYLPELKWAEKRLSEILNEYDVVILY